MFVVELSVQYFYKSFNFLTVDTIWNDFDIVLKSKIENNCLELISLIPLEKTHLLTLSWFFAQPVVEW